MDLWGRKKCILNTFPKENNILVSGYIDKKADEIKHIDELPVKHIYEMHSSKDYLLISLAAIDSELISLCRENGFSVKDFYYIFWDEQQSPCDYVYKGCKIGKFTYGAENLLLHKPVLKSVGRFCSINGTARIWGNHAIDYVTTHSFLDSPVSWPWEEYESEERGLLIEKYGKYMFDGKRSIRKMMR